MRALMKLLVVVASVTPLLGFFPFKLQHVQMALPGYTPSAELSTVLAPGDANFFRNGFPNNLRRNAGGEVDIADFPRRFHILTNEYVNQVMSSQRGFAPLTTIYFPFAQPIATEQLPTWAGAYVEHDAPIQLIDIDPQSPEYGRRFPLLVSATTAADSYRSENLLQILPTLGVNLRRNTTYAAVVTRDLPTASWDVFQIQHAQLRAALADWRESRMDAETHGVYAPLRQFLANDTDLAAADLIAATVWTTGDPLPPLRTGGRAVAALADQQGAADVSELTFSEDWPEYCVISGKVLIPGYQGGTPPYLGGGGDIEWDDAGQPIRQYWRDAEFVVTIPKHVPMPTAGFPMLNYIHGAGGLSTEVFERGPYQYTEPGLWPQRIKERGAGPSQVAAERGWASSGMAGHISSEHMGGWVFALHGAFHYNLFYPQVLYNNNLQLAWERLYFRRVLDGLRIDPDWCPDANANGANAFKFDPNLHVNMGQSHGHWVSSLEIAADPRPFQGVIFTGISGTMIRLWTNDELKSDLSDALVGNLLPGQTLDDFHPFLSLVQWFLGGVDPAMQIQDLFTAEAKVPPHVLAFSGLNDAGSDEPVQRTFLMAAGLDLAGPDLGDTYATTLMPHLTLAGLRQLAFPVTANRVTPYGPRTAVVTRHEDIYSDTGNGHHVPYEVPGAKHQYGCFLEALAAGQTPVINVGIAQGDACSQ